MRKVRISDVTLKSKEAAQLTFREKLDIVKLLDRLNVDVIEMPQVDGKKAEILFVKSAAKITDGAVISLSCSFSKESIDEAVKTLEGISHIRLQLSCPVSTVQMEYLTHKKPEFLIREAGELISYAKEKCESIEFCALDATRSDPEVLYAFIKKAIEAGADTVTVCDAAGNMLPDEYASFIDGIYRNVEDIDKVALAVSNNSQLPVAEICGFTGALKGAGEIKASARPGECAGIQALAKLLGTKGEARELGHNLRTVEINRVIENIDRIFNETKNTRTPFEDGVREDTEERTFTPADSFEDIKREIIRLGYDLTDDDYETVYRVYKNIVGKKGSMTSKEIDAIVANNAQQVPALYKVENYVINNGSILGSTAHMRIYKGDTLKESVSFGDGPIDAAFLAIEQITGLHYELDDFQIRALTEGRKAMGESIVKLRSSGKVYSGRGLSTDIIASGIMAYINALNKIAYEEENA